MNDLSQQATEAEDRLTMRSSGVQNRSRERVEQILAAAEVLIVETGWKG